LWASVFHLALEVWLGPCDPDPLRPRADVRREVGADVQSLCREQFLDRPRRSPLAVRPDDVDGRIRLLWIAEVTQQRAHAREPELLGPRRERLDPASW